MQFCSECNNMYYMRLSADDGGIYSDKLEFYCRRCGHEDSTLTNENIICVSEYQTQSSDMKLKNMINKYTKYDPTLPRANNILCPNPQCTNHTSSVEVPPASAIIQSPMPVSAIIQSPMPVSAMPVSATRTIKTPKKTLSTTSIGGATSATATSNIGQIQEESIMLKSRDSDIIYIRYDDENMKYAWICSKCDSSWTNDNHIDNKLNIVKN